jgi:multiple sugar transport system permease protein
MLSRLEKRNLRNGLIFISPWLIGFLGLQIYPICYSFYLSLTEYNGFGNPTFIGIRNFFSLNKDFLSLNQDPILPTTIYNTLYYTAFAVPIGIVVAIILALCMNQKVREVSVYRALLYLPSILPSFALVFVWLIFTNAQFGLLNQILIFFKLPVIDWIGNPRYTKPSLVILAQFGAGGPALIFLASLRSIPRDLYESAEIDGAGVIRKFFRITLPMLTPIILYQLIMGLSGGLQVFTQAYIISGGARGGTVGSQNSLFFYVLYIWRNAFMYSRMGYAASLSVLFFAVSVIIAMVVFRWGRSWVNYDV